VPDATVTPRVELDLAPNEFLQFSSILKAMSLGATYNGRIAVRAIAGSGRVAAYAATIDNRTQDPSYIPAQ
jgi:hypothetical protein